MVDKQIIKKITKYVNLIKDLGISTEIIYLFGSFANNTNTKDSDIDLMIVSKDFDKMNDRLAGKLWSLTKKVDSRIEPYFIGLERYNTDQVSHLIQIIKQEGIKISA